MKDNKSACHSFMNATEIMRLLGQRQMALLLMAHQATRTSAYCFISPCPYVHGGNANGPRGSQHIQWVAIQQRNPEFRKLSFFVMGNKHASLSLLYFKAVHYANILENIVQTKGILCQLPQNIQKCNIPWRIVS